MTPRLPFRLACCGLAVAAAGCFPTHLENLELQRDWVELGRGYLEPALARIHEIEPDPERARAYFERACDAGDPEGCAYLTGDVRIAWKDEARRLDAGKKGCNERVRNTVACEALGKLSEQDGSPQSLALAFEAYERGCFENQHFLPMTEGGPGNQAGARNCTAAARMLAEGRGVAADAERAARISKRGAAVRKWSE